MHHNFCKKAGRRLAAKEMYRHGADWSTLATESLISILELLPLHDRLRAGLTNSTWRTAANEATSSLALTACDGARQQLLQPWILQHGQHLTSIQLSILDEPASRTELKLLHCSKLRELMIEDGMFGPPLLPNAAATSLTRLDLQGTTPAAEPPWASAQQQCLRELCSFTNLQSLCLCLRRCSHLDEEYEQCCVTSSEVWDSVQHLLQLTHLELHAVAPIMGDCHGRISCLTKLQHLSLHEAEPHQASAQPQGVDQFDGMQHLQNLILLEFESEAGLQIRAGSASSIGQLTNLQSLALASCRCDFAALAAITALQSLSIVESPVSTAQLMAWLAQQQQLTSLTLCGDFWQIPAVEGQELDEAAEAVFTESFTAITASTALQVLDLGAALLPAGALASICLPGRVMAQLTSLHIPARFISLPELGRVDAGSVLIRTTLRKLVQCCPALQVLDTEWGLHLEPQISCLQHLTRLNIVRARDDASAGALTALTALQQLRLYTCSYMARGDRHVGWHDRDFAPLSQLSQLEGLTLAMLAFGAPAKPTDMQASMLARLTGLKSLMAPSLAFSEQQLSRLCCLTRLTEFECSRGELGALLVDRLRSLPSGRRARLHHTLHVVGDQAPHGLASELSQQLRQCFACNHQQLQQELADLRQQVSQLTAQRSGLAALVQTEQDGWRAARLTDEQFQSFSNRLSQLISLQGLPQVQQQRPAGGALAEAEQEADDAVWREFELRSIFVMARLQNALSRQQQEELRQEHAQQRLVLLQQQKQQQQLLLQQQQQQQQGALHPAPPIPEAPVDQGAGLLQQPPLQQAHQMQPGQQQILQQQAPPHPWWAQQQHQQQMMVGAAGQPGMPQLQHAPVAVGPPDLHLHLQQLQPAYVPLGAAMPPVINMQLHQGPGLPGGHLQLQPAPVPLGHVWPPGVHLPLQHAYIPMMGAAGLPGGHVQLPLQVPAPAFQAHAQHHLQHVLLHHPQAQQLAQQAAVQPGLQPHHFAMPQLH